jgi:hypothetical protein
MTCTASRLTASDTHAHAQSRARLADTEQQLHEARQERVTQQTVIADLRAQLSAAEADLNALRRTAAADLKHVLMIEWEGRQ